jgi:hypothetical protein
MRARHRLPKLVVRTGNPGCAGAASKIGYPAAGRPIPAGAVFLEVARWLVIHTS